MHSRKLNREDASNLFFKTLIPAKIQLRISDFDFENEQSSDVFGSQRFREYINILGWQLSNCGFHSSI